MSAVVNPNAIETINAGKEYKFQNVDPKAAIRVVSAKKAGNRLLVLVETDNPVSAHSLGAKKAAYAARSQLGYENAGIELVGIISAKEDDKLVYRSEYKLTLGI